MFPLGKEHSAAPPQSEVLPSFGAIVLAAGTASRMGRKKALLALGETSALERVVTALRQAGVSQIVAVTGYQEQELRPELARLSVRWVHNPHYKKGMFSSVQAAAAALKNSPGPAALEAFFVWPVDCPLVPPQVLERVLVAYQQAKPAANVIHHCCLGRRGHPPLLAASLLDPLVQAKPTMNLRVFLADHESKALGVEVDNPTILMDMDTPEDYQRMCRFARILDQATGLDLAAEPTARRATALDKPTKPVAGKSGSTAYLTDKDCAYLLEILGVPDHVQRHCQAVAELATAMGRLLVAQGQALDLGLVRSASLLHDLAKGRHKHAVVAEEILSSLGLRRLGKVVGCHMVIPADLVDNDTLSEEGLVYLADKLVREDQIVHLEERGAGTLPLYGSDPAALQGARQRIGAAIRLLNKVEQILGRRAITEVRFYLVRHAQSIAPENPRRFVGQADHPLSEEGVAQAQELALRLKDIPFDAAYTSDLSRCLSTVEILLGAPNPATPVHKKPALREIDTGLWEGLSAEEAKRLFPQEYARREEDVAATPFPGGESFEELEKRVAAAFERILSREKACLEAADKRLRNVLLVGHKNTNRMLLKYLLGLPFDQALSLPQDYCALNLIRVVTLADGSRQVYVESPC